MKNLIRLALRILLVIAYYYIAIKGFPELEKSMEIDGYIMNPYGWLVGAFFHGYFVIFIIAGLAFMLGFVGLFDVIYRFLIDDMDDYTDIGFVIMCFFAPVLSVLFLFILPIWFLFQDELLDLEIKLFYRNKGDA